VSRKSFQTFVLFSTRCASHRVVSINDFNFLHDEQIMSLYVLETGCKFNGNIVRHLIIRCSSCLSAVRETRRILNNLPIDLVARVVAQMRDVINFAPIRFALLYSRVHRI